MGWGERRCRGPPAAPSEAHGGLWGGVAPAGQLEDRRPGGAERDRERSATGKGWRNGRQRRLGCEEAVVQPEKAKPLSHRPRLGASGKRAPRPAPLELGGRWKAGPPLHP